MTSGSTFRFTPLPLAAGPGEPRGSIFAWKSLTAGGINWLTDLGDRNLEDEDAASGRPADASPLKEFRPARWLHSGGTFPVPSFSSFTFFIGGEYCRTGENR